MNVESELCVERGDGEITVQISGFISPYIPAKTYGPPERCYPAEGGDLEDFDALVNGEEFELTEEERARAEELLRQADSDACESSAEDATIAKAE